MGGSAVNLSTEMLTGGRGVSEWGCFVIEWIILVNSQCFSLLIKGFPLDLIIGINAEARKLYEFYLGSC